MRLFLTATMFFSLLGNAVSLAQTRPEAAISALADAIDRDDASAIGGLIEYPLALDEPKQKLFAQRYLIGSKLNAILTERFGEQEAQKAMHLARLEYLPPLHLDQLDWQLQQLHSPASSRQLMEGAIGSMPGNPRNAVTVVKTPDGWKARLRHAIPAIFALDVEDAPGRNRLLQRVTDDVKAGKLTTIEQVIDELVPRATVRNEPAVADRSTPAGAILAAKVAIENGDVETFVDSFEVLGGDDDGFVRGLAEKAVLEKKVETLIRAKYPPRQAERVIQQGLPQRNVMVAYESVAGWVEEGDVARAALKEEWYDVVRRLVRRDGIWRIQMPPRDTMRSPDDAEENQRQIARMKALREVLDHPERFATAGALLEALDPVRRERAADEVDAGEAARRQFEEIKQEMAKNPPKTPQEADEQALGLSLIEISVAVASKDAPGAARHYFAEGDDGSYVVARFNRLLAAQELMLAASKELGGDGTLALEFNLHNLADDIYALLMMELQIQGDRATPKDADREGEWIPPIRKIDGVWKIDVTDETAGNPKDAARRAADEARKIAELTTQVNAGKLISLDQLRDAMKAAGIRGVTTARG